MLHPDFRCDAVTRIETDVRWTSQRVLEVSFEVPAGIDDLEPPRASAFGRADELWRQSCFEIFIRSEDQEAYTEFNFALSGQWAVYGFDRYREAMRSVHLWSAPGCAYAYWEGGGLTLTVPLWTGGLDGLVGAGPWRMGLAAVIAEKNGRKSYWALAHPEGKPDFHHADCFALEVPQPSAP